MAPTSASLQASEELSARGATAPRVSLADLNAAVSSEHYFSALDGVDGYYRGGPEAQGVANANALKLLTICVLVLHNGFTILGKSAPASAENFDAEKGRMFAREDAIRQLWPLMGFSLRDQLHALKGVATRDQIVASAEGYRSQTNLAQATLEEQRSLRDRLFGAQLPPGASTAANKRDVSSFAEAYDDGAEALSAAIHGLAEITVQLNRRL